MKSLRTVLLGSLAAAVATMISPAVAQQSQPVGPYKDFNGTINLDVCDSKADWGPFTPKKAPDGAPNILFVLYDDTGLAAWSPYGGRINMPTLDKLAQNGLTYTQWHTVALCSPTRFGIDRPGGAVSGEAGDAEKSVGRGSPNQSGLTDG